MKLFSITFFLLVSISLYCQIQNLQTKKTIETEKHIFHLIPNSADSLENYLGFPLSLESNIPGETLKRTFSILPDTIKSYTGSARELRFQRSLVLSNLGFRVEEMNFVNFYPNYEDSIHTTYIYNTDGKMSGHESTSANSSKKRAFYFYNKHDDLVRVKGEYLDENTNTWMVYWQDSLHILKPFGKTSALRYYVKDTSSTNYQLKSEMYVSSEKDGVPITYDYFNYHSNTPFAFRHENVTWPFGFMGYRSYMSGNFPQRNRPFFGDYEIPFDNAIDFFKLDPYLYVIGTFFTNSGSMTTPIWEPAVKIELEKDTSDIFSIRAWSSSGQWSLNRKIVFKYQNGKLTKHWDLRKTFNSPDSLIINHKSEYNYSSNGYLNEAYFYEIRSGELSLHEEVKTEVITNSKNQLISQVSERKYFFTNDWLRYIDIEYIYNTDLNNRKDFSDDFRIFPNPFNERILIDFPVGNYTIEIYDVNGRLLNSFSNNGETRIEFDTRNLAIGLYVLKVSDNEGKFWSKRIMKN